MLKKQNLKSKPVCKVTFEVSPSSEVGQVFLVGDFNGWDQAATPMKRFKGGRFKVVLELDPNREYQFRYLAGGIWFNDDAADKYVMNEFGEDNSVVTT